MRGVIVRPYRREDRAELEAIWARQSASIDLSKDCEFPDPDHQHQIVTLVMEDEETGQVVGAGTARVGVELGMVLDPAWADPRSRLRAAMAVFSRGMREVWREGFTVVYARVVGKVRWADRLVEKFGFTRERWPVVKFDLTSVFGGR